MANIIVTAEETTINVNTTTETVNVSTTFSNIVLGESTVVSVDESIFDNGNLSGNITLDIDNARIQTGTLVGNVTAISFVGLEAGRSGTILLKQDAAGGNYLDTTTFPAAWSNWTFANNFKDIDLNANEWNVISFFYDGVKIYASLIVQQALAINNSDLANSTITVNGTTISLGSAGNITHFGSLTTTNLPEGANQYYTTARARGALSAGTGIAYNNTTGVISLSDTGLISGVTAGSGLTGGGDSGNVTLNVGAGTGITVNADNVAVNMTAFTTTDLAEGTNLYFTAARARGNVSATTSTGITYNSTTGVFSLASIPNSSLSNSTVTINGKTVALGGSNTLTTSDISEGTNLYYTDARANSAIAAYTATNPLTIGGNLQVNGNINATGNINYQNVTDLYVTDQKITLNSNAATNANVEIISNRPAATNTMLKWNEQATRWEFTNDGTTYYAIATSTTDLAEGTNLYYTTARANTAMDNYLVGGTGVSYSSGTIALDFTEFSTSNITEGTNLYYSNARVNAFIQDNITTSDIDEGTNLYFTAARARGNISAAENITYNSTTGVIGLANSLANVSSITAQSGQNLTLNTTSALITRQKYSNVDVFSGNISSDGYAFFGSNQYNGATNYFNYFGTTGIKNFIINTGNVTLGSNAITGVSLLNYIGSASPSLTELKANTFFSRNEVDFLPFPVGTRVTSVDVANSIVYMSANAVASANLAFSPTAIDVYGFNSALHDSQTGLTVIMVSAADVGAGSNTTLFATNPYPSSCYGYPASGPVITDFDVATDGSVSDYSLGAVSLSQFFIGRNKISSPKSVFQAPRGLIVGEGADLTNRAENDMLPSFGLNVLWNGRSPVTDYGGNTPLTQILVKNYTTNNLQSGNRTTSGPRLFFTSAEGDSSQPLSTTYPKKNLELGRISWWSTSSTQAGLSSVGPPAYISAVTGQDCVDTNSGVGMYFGISPNTLNFDRSLFMASSMGNTLIASAQDSTGTHRPIIFAPSHRGASQGNAALLYNQTIFGNDTITDTVQTSGAHFAQINYNNETALTGSRMAVTNGNNTNSSREGNIVLSIDRNLTSGNSIVQSRVANPASAFNYYGNNNPDRVRFTFAPQGLVDGTAVRINGFTNATVAGALNGNVFYVKRNDSGGYIGFELYTDSGLTTPVNLSVGNIKAGPGTFEYTRNNGVTAKDWSFTLPQGSNNLILTEDGVARTTFESGGNVTVTGNINLTGRLLGYDQVYGEFCYTAGNIQPAAADTIYAFPLDTTNMASDIVANNTSRINIVKPGRFKLITSIQVKNADNSADHIMRFWLRKNGADVANSATLITPLKLQEQVIAMDWMVESDGDDYWEIVYYVNNTGVSFPYYAAGTTPVTYPAAPPIIVNVIPVGA